MILSSTNSSIILRCWKVGEAVLLEIISIERVARLEQCSTLPYLIPYPPNGVGWGGLLIFLLKPSDNALEKYIWNLTCVLEFVGVKRWLLA